MQDFNADDLAEQTLSSRTVFTGRLLKVRVDTVRLPDGGTSTREIVEHPGAAAVVPLTDDNCVYMVRQWRHPVGRVTLEIPAGTLRAGEDMTGCLARELSEEIGMRAAQLVHLADIYVSQGYSNEVIGLFLGTGLSAAPAAADEDEKLQVVKLAFPAAVRMCLTGEIQDAKTVVALLMTHLRQVGGAR